MSDLLRRPLVLRVDQLQLSFCKSGGLPPCSLLLLLLFVSELGQALRVVDPQRGETEFSAAHTAHQSAWFFELPKPIAAHFGLLLVALGLFGANLLMGGQTVFVEGPPAVLTRGQGLVLVDLGGLLVVPRSTKEYYSRWVRSPRKTSSRYSGWGGARWSSLYFGGGCVFPSAAGSWRTWRGRT